MLLLFLLLSSSLGVDANLYCPVHSDAAVVTDVVAIAATLLVCCTLLHFNLRALADVNGVVNWLRRRLPLEICSYTCYSLLGCGRAVEQTPYH